VAGAEFQAHIADRNAAFVVRSSDHGTEVIRRRWHLPVKPLLEQPADMLPFTQPGLARGQVRFGKFRDGWHTVKVRRKFPCSPYPILPGFVLRADPPGDPCIRGREDPLEIAEFLLAVGSHQHASAK
jgi:hypothetical protein